MRIPKIIHQVSSLGAMDKHPPILRRGIDQLQELNPDWEYRLYSYEDACNFVAEFYPEIKTYYDRINPAYSAARADLFRYLIIHKFGGVYLDIKRSASVPFNLSIRPHDEFILSHWNNHWGAESECAGLHRELGHIPRGEYQQGFLAAVPSHPFLGAVISRVVRNIDRYNPFLQGVGRFGVLRVTGPIAYTLAIEPMLHLYPHRFVDSAKDLGLVFLVPEGVNVFPGRHYSAIREPVVELDRHMRLLFRILGPISELAHKIANEYGYRVRVRRAKRLREEMT